MPRRVLENLSHFFASFGLLRFDVHLVDAADGLAVLPPIVALLEEFRFLRQVLDAICLVLVYEIALLCLLRDLDAVCHASRNDTELAGFFAAGARMPVPYHHIFSFECRSENPFHFCVIYLFICTDHLELTFLSGVRFCE